MLCDLVVLNFPEFSVIQSHLNLLRGMLTSLSCVNVFYWCIECEIFWQTINQLNDKVGLLAYCEFFSDSKVQW